MNGKLPKTAQTVRCYAVVAFAMWLGGIGCLLGCCAQTVQAASAPTRPHLQHGDAGAVADTCAQQHACCHLRAASSKFSGNAVASFTASVSVRALPVASAAVCCRFAGGVTIAASKQRVIEDNRAAALRANDTNLARTPTPLLIFRDERFYLPDRAQTYLRCCVFLI